MKSIEKVKTHVRFEKIESKVLSVSATFDHDLVAIVGEKEQACKIYGFEKGQFIRNLTFNEKIGSPLKEFKSAIFSLNRKSLYTLCSNSTGKSYVTKWDAESGEFPSQKVISLHQFPAEKMVLSTEGFYLAISTQDGEIKSINTRYMEIDREGKLHDNQITSVEFTEDTRFILTTSEDGNYKFTPNIRAPGIMRAVFQYWMISFLFIFIGLKIYGAIF